MIASYCTKEWSSAEKDQDYSARLVRDFVSSMIRINVGSHLSRFAQGFWNVLGNLLFDVLVKVGPVRQRLFNVVGATCIKDKSGSAVPSQRCDSRLLSVLPGACCTGHHDGHFSADVNPSFNHRVMFTHIVIVAKWRCIKLWAAVDWKWQ